VVIAAPMLATVALFWQYIMRKLLDVDPWPEPEPLQPPPPTGGRYIVSARRFFRRFTTGKEQETIVVKEEKLEKIVAEPDKKRE
jgi:hypothetical protein